jgi:hypothetical protein
MDVIAECPKCKARAVLHRGDLSRLVLPALIEALSTIDHQCRP